LNPDAVKFVVTSVPFVAQIRNDPKDAPETWHDKSLNPLNDKWSAPPFTHQRDRIIRHIAANRIEYVVFLTGDMHCCYHAAMRIGNGRKYECTTVHELAGGPANQLQLAELTEFRPRHAGEVPMDRGDVLNYEIVLDRFHTEVNAVMHLRVKHVPDPSRQPGVNVPEIEWNVIRTVTDTGANAWQIKAAKSDGQPDERKKSIRIASEV